MIHHEQVCAESGLAGRTRQPICGRPNSFGFWLVAAALLAHSAIDNSMPCWAQVAHPAATILDRDKNIPDWRAGESYFQPADLSQFELRARAIQQRIDVLKEALARQQSVTANSPNLPPSTDPIADQQATISGPAVAHPMDNSLSTGDPVIQGALAPHATLESQTDTRPDDVSTATNASILESPVNSSELAASLFLTKNYAHALKLYERLLVEQPTPTDRDWLKCLAALCHRCQGNLPTAERLYREVVSSNEKTSLTDHAKWYLDYLERRKRIGAELQAVDSELQPYLSKEF